ANLSCAASCAASCIAKRRAFATADAGPRSRRPRNQYATSGAHRAARLHTGAAKLANSYSDTPTIANVYRAAWVNVQPDPHSIPATHAPTAQTPTLPQATATFTFTPEYTHTPVITSTPQHTNTPLPTFTPIPADTHTATRTPRPTYTNTRTATRTPQPTRTRT